MKVYAEKEVENTPVALLKRDGEFIVVFNYVWGYLGSSFVFDNLKDAQKYYENFGK